MIAQMFTFLLVLAVGLAKSNLLHARGGSPNGPDVDNLVVPIFLLAVRIEIDDVGPFWTTHVVGTTRAQIIPRYFKTRNGPKCNLLLVNLLLKRPFCDVFFCPRKTAQNLTYFH